jgi:hypothetical protein
MAKGKGSSGGRGHNPSKPNKKPQKKPDKKPQKQPDKKPPKKPDNKPPKKKHEGGSKIDFGDILKVILSQLATSAPERRPEQPSAPEPKPGKPSQAEMKALLDLIKIELAKKTPDQALVITLLTKIQDGLAANDGDAGSLAADLADTLKKLKGQK